MAIINLITKFATILAGFDYGIKGCEKLSWSVYRTMDPEQFAQDQCGVCIDYAAFVKDQLEKAGLEVILYCMVSRDDMGKPYIHVIPTFNVGDRIYVIEGSWKEPAIMGLRFYRSLQEMINVYYFLNRVSYDKTFVSQRLYKINTALPTGLTLSEFVSEVLLEEDLGEVESKFDDFSDYADYWRERARDGVRF